MAREDSKELGIEELGGVEMVPSHGEHGKVVVAKTATPSNIAWVRKMDDAVANSVVGRYFKIKERGTSFSTEVIGGVASFLTLAYITPVTSLIVSDTGATCNVHAPDEEYFACKAEIRKQLVTASALASLLGTLLMGLWANLPFLLAPGMGTVTYFAYIVVGYRGSGSVSYTTANAAVFLEGIMFLILSLSGLRKKAVMAMPDYIKYSMSGGIGLLLALVGMEANEGIGLITLSPNTLVQLGGCAPEHRHHLPVGEAYICNGGVLTSATTWLGLAAMIAMVVVTDRGYKAGLGAVILVVAFIAWIPNTQVSYWNNLPGSNAGSDRLAYFKKVVQIQGIDRVAFQFSFQSLKTAPVWLALVTFLYTDILETTGCVYAMARQAGLTRPDGSFEGDKEAFCVDAIGCSLSGLLGMSPLVTFLESSVGVELGAKTGIAAIVGALGFLLAIIFNPIIANIPPYATGPALIFVGALMMEHVSRVDWSNKKEALPAFLCVAIMPFTFSIAYGVIAAVASAFAMWVCHKGLDLVLGPQKKTLEPTTQVSDARTDEGGQ